MTTRPWAMSIWTNLRIEGWGWGMGAWVSTCMQGRP